jgi:hypothetical protein
MVLRLLGRSDLFSDLIIVTLALPTPTARLRRSLLKLAKSRGCARPPTLSTPKRSLHSPRSRRLSIATSPSSATGRL